MAVFGARSADWILSRTGTLVSVLPCAKFWLNASCVGTEDMPLLCQAASVRPQADQSGHGCCSWSLQLAADFGLFGGGMRTPLAGLFISVPGLRSHLVGLVQLHQEAFSQLPSPPRARGPLPGSHLKAQSLHGCPEAPALPSEFSRPRTPKLTGQGGQGLPQASVRSSPALLPLSSLPEGPFCHPTPMLLAPAHGLGLRSHQQFQETFVVSWVGITCAPIMSVALRKL